MTLDLTHLRPGMIVTVTLDGDTTYPTAELRDEPGVGLYAGPILVRLANGRPAPHVTAVAVEDDEDPEVEALARALYASFGGTMEFGRLSPTVRGDHRVAAGNLIAEGWRRNPPETVETVRDCFDDVTDGELAQVADRPETAPLSLLMSVASRRARKALEHRCGPDTQGHEAVVEELLRAMALTPNRADLA